MRGPWQVLAALGAVALWGSPSTFSDARPAAADSSTTGVISYSPVVGVGCGAAIDYPDVTNANSQQALFSYIISNPAAEFISVHFQDFNLPVGDYVRIRASNAGDKETRVLMFTGQGEASGSSFYSSSLVTSSIIVELFTSGKADAKPLSKKACKGFTIDNYRFLGQPGSYATDAQEAVCGTNEMREAACYSEVSRSASPLVRLLTHKTKGSFFCTGWLIGSEGHMITNNHCIADTAEAAATEYEFMAQGSSCTTDCTEPLACSGTKVTLTPDLVGTSSALDYTIIKLDSSFAQKYGYLQFRETGAVKDERIFIPQHPDGWGKQIAMKADDKFGSVEALDAVGCATEQVAYSLDTSGGSSGSPVIAWSDKAVVALHHCGGCPNTAVNADKIVADLRKRNILPANAVYGATAEATEAPAITTQAPTPNPTTNAPTAAPTSLPTAAPTSPPTAAPTSPPTAAPTSPPTAAPTLPQTLSPTPAPTTAKPAPTQVTQAMTTAPTSAPTSTPTSAPTVATQPVPVQNTQSLASAPTTAPTNAVSTQALTVTSATTTSTTTSATRTSVDGTITSTATTTSVDYIDFTVAEDANVELDILSSEAVKNGDSTTYKDVNNDCNAGYLDSSMFLFRLREDESITEADLVASNDDAPSGFGANDGSVNTVDSYLVVRLAKGSYRLAVGASPLTAVEAVRKLAKVSSGVRACDTKISNYGSYRLTVSSATNVVVTSPNSYIGNQCSPNRTSYPYKNCPYHAEGIASQVATIDGTIFRSADSVSVDHIPFTVAAFGRVTIEVSSFASSNGTAYVNVNGFCESSHIDPVAFLFRDNPAGLTVSDLVNVGDDDDNFAWRTRHSISFRDPFISLGLPAANYILAVGRYPMTLQDAIAHISKQSASSFTPESCGTQSASGNYQVLFKATQALPTTSPNSFTGTKCPLQVGRAICT